MNELEAKIQLLSDRITELVEEKNSLEEEKFKLLKKDHPVVFRILVDAKGSGNFVDFIRWYGCFTTRSKAEEYLSKFPQGRMKNHYYTSSVRSAATEELKSPDMFILDKPTYFKL